MLLVVSNLNVICVKLSQKAKRGKYCHFNSKLFVITRDKTRKVFEKKEKDLKFHSKSEKGTGHYYYYKLVGFNATFYYLLLLGGKGRKSNNLGGCAFSFVFANFLLLLTFCILPSKRHVPYFSCIVHNSQGELVTERNKNTRMNSVNECDYS